MSQSSIPAGLPGLRTRSRSGRQPSGPASPVASAATGVHEDYTGTARRLGFISAITTAVLLVVYMVTLVVGLLSLKAPDDPIGDPMFTMLEVEIIVLMPAIVALMVAVYAWSSHRSKPLSLTGLLFMFGVAAVTCVVHFLVLTLSRQAAFAGHPWSDLVFQFSWPSVAYALDILAWDVFFPLSVLFAAGAFSQGKLARTIRTVLVVSGALSLAGLSGVVTGNMQLRDIGIVGYVPVFLVAVVLLAVLFRRSEPSGQDSSVFAGGRS